MKTGAVFQGRMAGRRGRLDANCFLQWLAVRCLNADVGCKKSQLLDGAIEMQTTGMKGVASLRNKTFLACTAALYGGTSGLVPVDAQAQTIYVGNGKTQVYDSEPFIVTNDLQNSSAVWVAAGGTLVVEGVEVDVSSDGNKSPALKITGSSSNPTSVRIVGLPGKGVMSASNASEVVSLTAANTRFHLENIHVDALATNNQTGISVSNAREAHVALKNVSIDAGGTGVYYASFNGSGSLSMEDVVIRTQDGRGVDANYTAADISLRNFDIKTGLAADARSGLEGVLGAGARQMTLENGRIETFSRNSSAVETLDVDALGMTGSMKNVEAITHGDGSDAVEIMNAASFLVEDSSVTTNGNSAHAVAAYNGGVSAWPSAHVLVKDSAIVTTGQGSAGLYLGDSSTVSTDGVTVNTSGVSSHGAYVLSTAGFTFNNSSMATTGDRAHGISKRYTANSGAVGLSNSTISVSGADASGIMLEAQHSASRQADNTLTLEQSTVSSTQAAAIAVRGGVENLVRLSQSHVRSGAGGVVLQVDPYDPVDPGLPSSTRFVLDDRSTAEGDLVVNNGELGVRLSNYSVFSGAARVGKDDLAVALMDIDRVSGWNMTGSSTVGALNHDGFIRFSAPAGNYKTLTVQGDMVSGGNGLLALNSQLGDDRSPTDLLQIRGDQVGHSYLTVVNRDGKGGLTSRGIKVVEIEGGAKGSFTLVADYLHRGAATVVGGAYAYKLYQGGTGDPGDHDWYLRSNGVPSDGDDDDGGEDPEEGGGGTEDPDEDGDGGGQDGEDEGPTLQEGAPLYEVYSQMLLNLQRLPTLTQRRGPGYLRQQPDGDPHGSHDGVWIRTEGLQHRLKPRSSTAKADYRMKGLRLQIGADRVLSDSAQGQWVGGLSGHYTYGEADVKSRHSPGRIKTDGLGIDGTMTWYGAEQRYVDLQGRLVRHTSDLIAGSSGRAVKEDSHAFGYALSAEVGQAFESSPQWAWTPQAQLRYTNVRFEQFEDIYGASVRATKHASLQARLGMMAERRFAAQSVDQNEGGSVYGVLDLYHEFLNGTEIQLSGLRMTNRDDRLRGGVGAGGSYRWNEGRYAIYGEGSFNTSLKHFRGSTMYRAMVGLKIRW